MEGENPNIKKVVEEKSISLVEKCAPPVEVRIIKKYVLAALIEHAFNFFFVVILGFYIFLILGALKYYELLYAVAAIAFMSPYFVMMLQVLPFLKGFYIEKYATSARDVGLTNNVGELPQQV